MTARETEDRWLAATSGPLWAGLDARSRESGPTMTITKAQYAALRETIDRLTTALRVATHEPHDQSGPPAEGFPTCSGCGAILTGERERPRGSICRCGLARSYHLGANPLADHEYEPRYPARRAARPSPPKEAQPDA